MTAPGATSRRPAAARLTGIGLLAAGVAVALYVAGRLLTPNYNVSLSSKLELAVLLTCISLKTSATLETTK